MKNLTKFYLLFLCLSFIGFAGCSDEDDDIKVYMEINDFENNKKVSKRISSLETPVLYSAVLRIEGGDGNYSAKSSDENTASASIVENYLHLYIHKTGTVQVTIESQDLKKFTLPVTITEGEREIKILNNHSWVTTENEETTETKEIIEKIKKEIEAKALPKDARFELTYNSKTKDYEKYEGTYILYPNTESSSQSVEGTFKEENIYEDEARPYRMYTFSSNGSEDIYTINKFEIDLNLLRTSIATTQFLWVKDYTEEYKLKYPELKLKEVLCVQHIYIKV